MDKYKLIDLIYDKLADNDEQEQFEPSMTEEMCVVNDWQNGGEPLIAIVINGVEYVLTLKEHSKPSEWQVYEPGDYDKERHNEKEGGIYE